MCAAHSSDWPASRDDGVRPWQRVVQHSVVVEKRIWWAHRLPILVAWIVGSLVVADAMHLTLGGVVPLAKSRVQHWIDLSMLARYLPVPPMHVTLHVTVFDLLVSWSFLTFATLYYAWIV